MHKICFEVTELVELSHTSESGQTEISVWPGLSGFFIITPLAHPLQRTNGVVVLLFYVHGKQPWSCRYGH